MIAILTRAKFKLSWEPLAIEEMEVTNSNIVEMSAEVGGQPHRKSWKSLVKTFEV